MRANARPIADDDRSTRSLVATARAEPVRAEPDHDRGDKHDERQRERQCSEADELPREPERRLDADAFRAEPDDEPEQEVARGAVEQSGDEGHDDEHEPVDRAIVHDRSPRRREEDSRGPGEDRDREHGLGACVDVHVVGLSECGEHRPGCGQKAGHAPPPRTSRSLTRRGELRAAAVGLLDRLDGWVVAHTVRVRLFRPS